MRSLDGSAALADDFDGNSEALVSRQKVRGKGTGISSLHTLFGRGSIRGISALGGLAPCPVRSATCQEARNEKRSLL